MIEFPAAELIAKHIDAAGLTLLKLEPLTRIVQHVYDALEFEDRALHLARVAHYQWFIKATQNTRLEHPEFMVMFNDLPPERQALTVEEARTALRIANVKTHAEFDKLMRQVQGLK